MVGESRAQATFRWLAKALSSVNQKLVGPVGFEPTTDGFIVTEPI